MGHQVKKSDDEINRFTRRRNVAQMNGSTMTSLFLRLLVDMFSAASEREEKKGKEKNTRRRGSIDVAIYRPARFFDARENETYLSENRSNRLKCSHRKGCLFSIVKRCIGLYRRIVNRPIVSLARSLSRFV